MDLCFFPSSPIALAVFFPRHSGVRLLNEVPVCEFPEKIRLMESFVRVYGGVSNFETSRHISEQITVIPKPELLFPPFWDSYTFLHILYYVSCIWWLFKYLFDNFLLLWEKWFIWCLFCSMFSFFKVIFDGFEGPMGWNSPLNQHLGNICLAGAIVISTWAKDGKFA